jgi:hypothetical protein
MNAASAASVLSVSLLTHELAQVHLHKFSGAGSDVFSVADHLDTVVGGTIRTQP